MGYCGNNFVFTGCIIAFMGVKKLDIVCGLDDFDLDNPHTWRWLHLVISLVLPLVIYT